MCNFILACLHSEGSVHGQNHFTSEFQYQAFDTIHINTQFSTTIMYKRTEMLEHIPGDNITQPCS